jgi:hypothetical protein
MVIPNRMRVFYTNSLLYVLVYESLPFLKFTAECTPIVSPGYSKLRIYYPLLLFTPNVLRCEKVYSQAISSISFSLETYIVICWFSDTLVPSCPSGPLEITDRKYLRNVSNAARFNNMTS